MEDADADAGPAARAQSCGQWRNWTGFWLLGLCNNFAYVVMLSAAHDILKRQESNNASATASMSLTVDVGSGNSSNSSVYDCNPVSTGAVLLADILPTLVIKLCAPFVVHNLPYGVRVSFCVVMAATSFLLVSFSSAVWMSILGVIFASISAGLGELSFLSLTVFFNSFVAPETSRDYFLEELQAARTLTREVNTEWVNVYALYCWSVLEGWGSGTGAAGVAGAFLYSGLIQAGLSPRITLLIMLVVPLLMVVSYFGLLVPVSPFPQWRRTETEAPAESSEERRQLMDGSVEEEGEKSTPAEERISGALSFTEKLQIIRALLKFVVPLGLVYFAEYFINQGLMELLFFPDFFLSHAEQYRWYQVLYQVGVLLSRSSLRCVKIRKIWTLSLLQVVNAVFLLVAVGYQFLPGAWFVFAVVVYEGLLGGAAYVNTFYFISKETEDRHREFAMAAASVGDSLGIAVAGLAAFPVHSYFCSL